MDFQIESGQITLKIIVHLATKCYSCVLTHDKLQDTKE